MVMTTHVSEDAEIFTDKWLGYNPSKTKFNITQILSRNALDFPDIHNLIMNIKSWIRGMHHHVSMNIYRNILTNFVLGLTEGHLLKTYQTIPLIG
jgi:hypothetical protein